MAGFLYFYVAREKWSGQNRISGPHWEKIRDDHNGQINLRAKQKYEVLSAAVLMIRGWLFLLSNPNTYCLLLLVMLVEME